MAVWLCGNSWVHRGSKAAGKGFSGWREPQLRPRPAWRSVKWLSMGYTRITTDPRQMGGAPCLRGLRIPVATVVGLVAEGQTTEDILALYPDLEADDIREALLFAAEAVRERALPLAAGE